ncbi:hypothetical protein GO003_018210 [Methylicorpusculum oleiharenae]|uniref:hypothetical protein n=1 Tax=Methylicorpusculum oleiharenae TaxID=1338687 RepID=UPI00135B3F43|nr:hypothetical protein [Methylicorpusculum oleiharenae]MCD2452327.1 hypothetical protein [Methylicorpusculum oleiharenae]
MGILRAATFAVFWRALLSDSGVTYMNVGKGREQGAEALRKQLQSLLCACFRALLSTASSRRSLPLTSLKASNIIALS